MSSLTAAVADMKEHGPGTAQHAMHSAGCCYLMQGTALVSREGFKLFMPFASPKEHHAN